MGLYKRGQWIQGVRYNLYFENARQDGSGYGFSCDKDGNVDYESLPDHGKIIYNCCLNGTYAVLPSVVRVESYSHWEPGTVQCECGKTVELPSSWANECSKCGYEYNGFGQLLAPRAMWGGNDGI